MESIMSELLKKARGQVADAKHIQPMPSFHCNNSLLAPEDLRTADYVAPSESTNESPSSDNTSVWETTADVTCISPCERIAYHGDVYTSLDSDEHSSDSEISDVSISSGENNCSTFDLGNITDHVASLMPTYLHFESPRPDVYSPQQPAYIHSQYAFPSPPSLSYDVTVEHYTGSENDSVSEVNITRSPFSMDASLESTSSSENLSDTSNHVINAMFTCMDDESTFQNQFSFDCYSDYGNYTSTPTATSGSGSPSRDTLYWCHACNDACANPEDAETHQMLHKMDDVGVQLSEELFNRHGYITCHEEIKDFNRIKCCLCDKIFGARFFPRHLRLHEEKQVVGTCHASTSIAPLVGTFSNRPESTGHNYLQKKYIQCSFCGMRCRSNHTRVVHERSHIYRKPYVCTMPGCDKSFDQHIHLRLHMRVHKNN